jgi:DNA replication protein DnaC
MKLKLPDDYINNNPEIIKQVRADLERENNFHYLFMGVNGAGKTYLAEIIRESFKIRFSQPADNFVRLEARTIYDNYINKLYSNFSDKAEALRKIENSLRRKAVIFDDIGTERNYTKDAKASLFVGSLLEDRYEWIEKGLGTHTIITTNLSGKEIQNLYGDRVLDRLYQHFTIMYFNNHSFRADKIKSVGVKYGK